MKELFQIIFRSFGQFGGIGRIALFTIPVICILDLNIFVELIVMIAPFLIPIFGWVIELAVWIWAFVIAVTEPSNIFDIPYFVALAIYIAAVWLPMLCALYLDIRHARIMREWEKTTNSWRDH